MINFSKLIAFYRFPFVDLFRSLERKTLPEEFFYPITKKTTWKGSIDEERPFIITEEFSIIKIFNGIRVYHINDVFGFVVMEINYGGIGIDPYVILSRIEEVGEKLDKLFQEIFDEKWTDIKNSFERMEFILGEK